MVVCKKVYPRLCAFFAALTFFLANASAVILFRTGSPTANTSAPSNDFAGSGWNYEGLFGNFLGTPIAPHFFMTGAHIGQAGADFIFQNVTYTLINHFNDPQSDLAIWQVAETFPLFAPHYSKQDEVGQHLIAIGRGTRRGNEVLVSGNLRGWEWGASDGVQRWGENTVASIVPIFLADTLYATFDQNGLFDECHLSGGDSGGALFLNDNGVWKLAGIHYTVDGNFYADAAGNGAFIAALFDMWGFWVENSKPPPAYVQITGANPVPSGFYSTRISTRVGWIYSVIDPSSDLDSDRIANLLEYALNLDPLAPDAAGLPQPGREGSYVTITYTKVTTANDIQYVIEQSTDLVSWTTANPQNEIVSSGSNLQIIKAKVDIGTVTKMFLRLRVTRS